MTRRDTKPNGELHRTLGDSVASDALSAGMVSESSNCLKRLVFLIASRMHPGE